tara:strand:- start:602 stop:898 length:297 start_codon:yes stop_codon:yes gene_type:complete
MYMNNFEIAKWPHIVKKEKDMLGRVFLYAEEMANRKHAQRPHRGGRRVFKLTEVLKRTLTAPTAYLRSLKDKVRNKIEQKDKTPRYLSGLRKQNRNGK